MSKEKIRKVIEGMERSGKMKNVVLAKQVKGQQTIERPLKEYLEILRGWQATLTDLMNEARTQGMGATEDLINKVQRSAEKTIGETRNALASLAGKVF